MLRPRNRSDSIEGNDLFVRQEVDRRLGLIKEIPPLCRPVLSPIEAVFRLELLCSLTTIVGRVEQFSKTDRWYLHFLI